MQLDSQPHRGVLFYDPFRQFLRRQQRHVRRKKHGNDFVEGFAADDIERPIKIGFVRDDKLALIGRGQSAEIFFKE